MQTSIFFCSLLHTLDCAFLQTKRRRRDCQSLRSQVILFPSSLILEFQNVSIEVTVEFSPGILAELKSTQSSKYLLFGRYRGRMD